MSRAQLADVYQLALNHADASTGPRDEYLPTYEGSVMVEGMEVQFHIDNSPAIYYDVGDSNDLVYVDDSEGTGPVVDQSTFIARVIEIAAEQYERYTE